MMLVLTNDYSLTYHLAEDSSGAQSLARSPMLVDLQELSKARQVPNGRYLALWRTFQKLGYR